MQQLQMAFYANYSRKVAAVFENNYIGTYLIVSDGRRSPFFGNWVANAKLMTDAHEHSHMSIVNVALDEGAVAACDNVRRALLDSGSISLSCVSLAGWLPATVLEGDSRVGSCENNVALWTKPHILKAAVAVSNHPVMMIDTDVILYKDLMTLGANMLLGSNGSKQMVAGEEGHGLVNTGTVFASRVSVPLLLQWAEQVGHCMFSKEADKGALQHVIHYGGNPTVETFALNLVGQCEKKGRFATHYNCVAEKKKVATMKGMQNWVDSISTDPKELMKPGQLISLQPAAKPAAEKAAEKA